MTKLKKKAPQTKVEPWATVSTEVVFDTKNWVTVFKDIIKTRTGRIVEDYYRIKAGEYVLIYATTRDARVVVERQYKHGIGVVTTTLPAGFIDDGETPLAAAKRELFEETGYQSAKWKDIGAFVVDGTRYYGTAHCFIAEDIDLVGTPVESDMEELEVSLVTVTRLFELVAAGEISLLPAISMIAMATNPLFERMAKPEVL